MTPGASSPAFADSATQRPESRRVLGTTVHATTYDAATQLALEWAHQRRSATVCATSVHGVIEASDDPEFQDILNTADLVTPDGMPLVWALRRLGVPGATRVYGPTLTLRLCAAAEAEGVAIGLYGGTPDSLGAFEAFLERTFPALRIAISISPPFRPPTAAEDDADTRAIADSGAGLVFVGIGCPKQERWMAAHRGRIPAVMVGVGAAFDFHAGRVRQAPPALQRAGLEWAFRLAVEPRRLWRRYARIVPRFVVGFGRQLAARALRPA